MIPHRSARLRLSLAAGALLSVGALFTAATFTDAADVHVFLDGSQNTFEIRTAGSVRDGWVPSEDQWQPGRPAPYEIALEEGTVLAPGGSISLRIAAQNASPRLAGTLSLSIVDPDPRGDEIDPDTGRFVELFDQLQFTVRDGDRTLMDRVPAPELTTYTWDDAFEAGEHRLLDVRIDLPDTVDNRWQGAGTGVQFQFEGENR
ncbi:hypothetical protein [Microbacterium thalli]|uniref:Uncharacterized protein n=1 Tax=Microbacterium thalli TaxID=3027921 RepID=A0ABT5SDT2_9MICO|nr:hypothetical protein [Microbacterium thalli]MDD7960927.1 hypothetical protein [Microbacterium thalli]MDN8548843.1 hypothetical protein [Microbacterium thalli]